MKQTSKIEHQHRRHHHPNHYGFHSKVRESASTNLFLHQNAMAELREKYTRSDLHHATPDNFLQMKAHKSLGDILLEDDDEANDV
jgi:hypothetical protein